MITSPRSTSHFLAASAVLLLGMLIAMPIHADDKGKKDNVESTEAEPPVDPRLFQALAWRNIGPFRGGRATTVAGVPQQVGTGQAGTYYFGATGGGVWKTEDDGIAWRNVSDGFFRTGSVGALAVAPSDPNIVWAGMGEAAVRGVMTTHGDGVYRSLDAGATWEHMGLGDTRHISEVIVHPHDPDVVWVAAQGHLYGPHEDRGVYRTSDGGRTWLKTLYVDSDTGPSDLTIDPTNPRVLYAGMWRHRRYPWKVESGGQSGSSPGEGGLGSGIHKSTDGGLSWTRLEGGLPPVMGKIGVAVSPARPARVWAIVEAEDGGLYRSDDAGTSWRRINEERVLRARAWYYTHITADPSDADTVYVMNAPLMRSIDGGETFVSIGVPHGDNHDLWIDPNDSNRMINANDGGANVSTNGGRTWSTQGNQPTAQFYRINADHRFPYWIYGGQQDNSAIAIKSRNLDGGAIGIKDWHSIGGCESAWPAFDRDNPRYVYAGCYQGIIDEYDMETGLRRGVMAVPFLGLGAEPKDLPYRFNWNAPILVSEHDSAVIYHAGNVVLRSEDRGRSWQEISPDLTRDEEERQGPGGGPITNEAAGGETYNTIASLAESTHDAQTLVAGTDDGRVHITRDGGVTWTDISPGEVSTITDLGSILRRDALDFESAPSFEGAQINTVEISTHAPSRLLLAVQRYELDDLRPYIFLSDDAGATWTLRTGGLPEDATVRVVREDPARRGLLYAGTEVGVFMSFDAGTRWQPLELGLPKVPVTDLMVHRGDLLASTQGRAFWVLDDLSPLHAIELDATETDVLSPRLLPPRPALRTTGGRAQNPTGAGTNADNGALVHFVLPEPPPEDSDTNSDEVSDAEPEAEPDEDADADEEDDPIVTTLEIRDAQGTLVRTVSSREDKADDDDTLPSTPGLNRFVWDLRGEPMLDVPDALVFGDRGGYRIAPGRYTLTLRHGTSSDEASWTESLEVQPDPRIANFGTYREGDYAVQQALLASIRTTIQSVHDGVTRMRDARDQIDALLERVRRHRAVAGTVSKPAGRKPADDDPVMAAFEAAVERATEAIDDWEGSVIQPQQETFQDVINFPNRLNAELFQLLGEIDTLEPIVNQGARDRFRDLESTWATHAERMQSIVDDEIAAIDDLIQEHTLPAVMLPASRLPQSSDAQSSGAQSASAHEETP